MPKQKAPKGGAPSDAPITDSRFTSFATDPRFRLPSKKHTRTQIDKRFSRMLKDDDFSSTAKVDRYGRKLSSSGKKKALERLYQPAEESEEEEEDDDEAVDQAKDEEEEDIEVEDDAVVERELRRAESMKSGYDAARGGGFSSSEDEDEDEEEDDGGVDVEDQEQFPDMAEEQQGVPMGEVTSRIAVVNLDWDNISSSDLFAVFSSFVPAGGRILKVSVYRSEFGKERMEREEMEGPPPEIFAREKVEEESEIDSEDEEDEEEDDEDEDEKIKKDLLKEDDGKDFDSGALRQYQLERLRYYYAIVICSDKATAQVLYESTDGTEYLSSANFLDMRFVPDDTDFDDKPRDECVSVPTGYKPTEFVTDALQHSKVKLTWDAEDAGRKDAIKRAFTGSRSEINDNDLRAYLGSDSSDDEEEEEGAEEATEVEQGAEDATEAPKLTKKELARQKMRAALGLKNESAKGSKVRHPVGDMEVTFTAGLAAEEKGNVFENEPSAAQRINETTAEAYSRKEKERKERRKQRSRAKREGRDPDAVVMPEVAVEANDDLGFNDPFFASDEETKTKATKSLRQAERQKKRETKKAEAAEKESHRAELELLMQDNSNDTSKRLEHFDINEIARAEKMKKKKSKYAKLAKLPEVEGGKRGGLQGTFEMDVTDPRFKAVFESHEFAIDPSNPKFKGTEGMKKLLEEGRRKRKAGNDGDDAEVEVVKKSKKNESGSNGAGLSSLIDRVKRKSKN